jgi:cathepsin D
MGSYSVSKTGFRAYIRFFTALGEFNLAPVVGTTVTNNLLTSPISGLIGLAFAGLSQTGTPFWQAIIGGNQASAPEMGFWLSRFRGTSNPTNEEPGGAFTFGGVNASLYTGDIEFLALTGTASAFWSLDLSGLSPLNRAPPDANSSSTQQLMCKARP